MLEDFLPLVAKPARYINNEINSRKLPISVSSSKRAKPGSTTRTGRIRKPPIVMRDCRAKLTISNSN